MPGHNYLIKDCGAWPIQGPHLAGGSLPLVGWLVGLVHLIKTSNFWAISMISKPLIRSLLVYCHYHRVIMSEHMIYSFLCVFLLVWIKAQMYKGTLGKKPFIF